MCVLATGSSTAVFLGADVPYDQLFSRDTGPGVGMSDPRVRSLENFFFCRAEAVSSSGCG